MYSLPKHILSPDPEIYFSTNYLTIDLETTIVDGSPDPVDSRNHVVLTCYKQGTQEIYRFGNELEISDIAKLCEEVDFIVCHNAKFELQWLRRAGADLAQIVVFDTLLADYTIAGNRSWKLDLNSVANRYGLGTKDNLVSQLIKGGVCPSTIPESLLLKYCKKDVSLTEKLFNKQLSVLKREGLLNTFYTKCLFTPVLADVEFNGLHLDKQAVTEAYTKAVWEYEEVKSKMDKMTGGINPNSSDQVATFVYKELGFKELTDRRGNPKRNKANKKWPEGKPLTDSETILALKATNKKQTEFKVLKKQQSTLNAELTKALKKFYDCVDTGNLLHARLNQSLTQTHRLSSSGKPPYNAQLQNIKRSHKKFITARKEGWKMIEADWSKIEFAVAAFLSQDIQAMDDVTNNFDVHRYSAAVMKYGENIAVQKMAEITKEERTAAKKNTFKPLFFGKSGTSEQMLYYAAFRKKYPEICKMQEKWISTVLRTGKLKTITGLVFYWPDTKTTYSGFVTNSNSICNYPVQNFATSEMSSIGTVYLWHRMKSAKLLSFIVNCVHDSVWTETKQEEEGELKGLMNQALIKDVDNYLKKVYNISYNLPIEIEITNI